MIFLEVTVAPNVSWVKVKANFDESYGIEEHSGNPYTVVERLAGAGITLQNGEFSFNSLYANNTAHTFVMALRARDPVTVNNNGTVTWRRYETTAIDEAAIESVGPSLATEPATGLMRPTFAKKGG